MAQFFYNKLHCLCRAGELFPGLGNPDISVVVASAPHITYQNLSDSRQDVVFTLNTDWFADVDIIIKYRNTYWEGSYYTNTGIGIVFRYIDDDNFYYVSSHSNPDKTNNFGVLKYVNGSRSEAVSPFNKEAAKLFKWVYYRARVIDNKFQHASWAEGETPPALSTVETFDQSGGDRAGAVGLWFRGDQACTEVEFISFATDGDEPLLSGDNAFVSGAVEDVEGLPCAREVRLFLRETGQMIGYTTSDETDGTFSISTPFVGKEHDIRVMDNGNLQILNDIVASRVVA